MTEAMAVSGERLWNWLRLIGWTGGVVLLLLPLVAMQLGAPGVHWTLSDFLVMGALIAMAGLILELATRRSRNLSYRFAATFAVVTSFLLVWVNLAVGFLGDEGNPANLMFLGVIAIGFAGALLAGSRAAGMAQAMMVTAAAQVLAGIVGYAAGWSSPGEQGVYEVVMGTSLFTALWLASAFLFTRAARAGA